MPEPRKYRPQQICVICLQPKGFTRYVNGHVCCSAKECKEAAAKLPVKVVKLARSR